MTKTVLLWGPSEKDTISVLRYNFTCFSIYYLDLLCPIQNPRLHLCYVLSYYNSLEVML